MPSQALARSRTVHAGGCIRVPVPQRVPKPCTFSPPCCCGSFYHEDEPGCMWQAPQAKVEEPGGGPCGPCLSSFVNDHPRYAHSGCHPFGHSKHMILPSTFLERPGPLACKESFGGTACLPPGFLFCFVHGTPSNAMPTSVSSIYLNTS